MTRGTKRLIVATAVMCGSIAATPAPVSAQAGEPDGPAAAVSRQAFQLSPSAPSVSRSIVVDRTRVFSIALTAASPMLHVELVAPDGRRFVVGDRIPDVSDGGLSMYRATFANPVPGLWSLDVSDPVPPTANIDVGVLCTFDNAVRLTLAGAGDTYPAGVPVRLAFALFDGTSRNRALSPRAHLFLVGDPTFVPVSITFTDDGKGADEAADDAIYEALVNPGRPGTFQLQVDVDGVASTGRFHRSSAGNIRVVERTADITAFTARDVDIDQDGLFDQIVVSPLAALLEDGDYLVTARLRGSNGREIERSVEARLAAGVRSADVVFDAADMLSDIGVDGPYHVAEVSFLSMIGGGLVPAGIRYDIGDTDAYQLASFGRALVRLSGAGAAIGVDTMGDGLIDRLDVTVELITDVSGTYSFSASLTDSSGNELGFAAGSESLDAGRSAVTLRIPAEAIGRHAIKGPYCLSNLVIFGAGQSLVAAQAPIADAGVCEPSNRRAFSPAVESLLGAPPRGSGNGQQRP